MRQAACCLQKHQKLGQIGCYNEEKHEPVCFPGRSVAATIQVSQGKNTSFAIRPQFPSSQKHVSQQLQSCVKTLLRHSVTFHQKRSGASVLWVLTAIPVVTLIRWKCTTHGFHGRGVKQLVSFRELKIMTKAVVVMKSKVNQCVFLACLGCNYPASIGGKYRFLA